MIYCKADLKEIKNTHCIDEDEASEPGDDKYSTTLDTVKEFKNSERVKRVPFTPEKDSFIHKLFIKKNGFGHWMAILRYRKILEAVTLLIVSRKEQKNYLASKNKFLYHKRVVHKLVNNHMLTLPLPSLLVPTPFTKGRGSAGPPCYLKTCCPISVKFCRVLETPLKVLEMLKLFT